MFPLIFLTFLIDIISVSIFNKYIIDALLGCLIATSFQKKNNSKIITILTLLSLEAFLRYGRFGFDLGPLLILTIISKKTNKLFVNPYYINAFILSVYLIFKIVFLETFLLGLSFSFYNLITQLMLNVIILELILKISLRKQNLIIAKF